MFDIEFIQAMAEIAIAPMNHFTEWDAAADMLEYLAGFCYSIARYDASGRMF